MIFQNDKEKLVQIETRPEAGRKVIGPARRFWIEPDLLYPLLKGAADFSACHIHVDEELYVLVPNRGIVQSEYMESEKHLMKLKATSSYFKRFKTILGARSTKMG